MIIGIHQPNFIPWYPFFQKMQDCDIFVILQNCQFEKNNYQNRFMYKDLWYTMSVNRGLESIVEKKYINYKKDFDSIKTKLSIFNHFLSQFDDLITESLAVTNSAIIEKMAQMLNIKTKIVYDYPTELRGTKRLIDICKKYGADTYLSGISGANYMDMNEFDFSDIKVVFQKDLLKVHSFDILQRQSKNYG